MPVTKFQASSADTVSAKSSSPKAQPAEKATTARKTTAKKTTAAKKTSTAKTAAAAVSDPAETVYVQFAGREVLTKEVVDRVHEIWTKDLKKNKKDLKEVKIYIKPEESAAYYVFNGTDTGSIEL